MRKMFKDNLFETLKTIYPIVLIVVLLTNFIIVKPGVIFSFLLSAITLAIGIALFTMGAELSLVNIGKKIGNKIVKSKNIYIVLFVSFILGTILTVAEPDLRVLADQILNIPSNLIIITVGIGVGLYLVVASVRSLFGLNLNTILIFSYLIIFALLFFVPDEYIPFAFDSGSVTTGAISIPFIITLGAGLVSSRSDKKAKEDSFGLISLCSTGPIITVLILSIINKSSVSYNAEELVEFSFNISTYIEALLNAIKDIGISLLPILCVYIIYELICKESSRKEIKDISSGFIFAFIGLVLFLLSVNTGFMDVSILIGNRLAMSNYSVLLIPLVMVLAYFIATAEPSIMILVNQAQRLTGGSVTKKELKTAVALGVSFSAGLSILRIFTRINILIYLIPCYFISIMLTFIIPKYITALAFDTGGSTGGTLTTAFLFPLSLGACAALNGNVLTDAFGMSAFMSIIPVISVELIGVLSNIRIMNKNKLKKLDDTIIDFEIGEFA